MSNLKWQFLTGDIDWKEYGGKFVSQRLNNGEFDYWIVIDWTNMQHDRDSKGKYYATVSVVAPSQMTKRNMQAAIDSCGFTDEDLHDFVASKGDLAYVEMVSEWMGGVTIWQGTGNNADNLMKEAKHEAGMCESFTFGFAMDRSQNALGTTGWQKLTGKLYPWKGDD